MADNETIVEREMAMLATGEEAVAKLHQMVNGDEATVVVTDAGPVPSLKKWQADAGAFFADAADRTETARDETILGAELADDLADGLSKTDPAGENGKSRYFRIFAPERKESFIYYRHDSGGIAAEMKRYPSLEGVIDPDVYNSEKKLFQQAAPLPYNGDLAWAIVDSAGQVVLGITDDGRTVGQLASEVGSSGLKLANLEQLSDQAEIEKAQAPTDGVPATGVDFVWAVTDAAGVVALGIRADGTVFYKSPDVQNVKLYAADDLVYSIVDDGGKVVFGITSTGAVVGYQANQIAALAARVSSLEGTGVVEAISGLVEYDAQPLAYSKNTGTFDQLFIIGADGETAATPASYNAVHPQVLRNSYIKFGSDRDGAMKLWRKSLYGPSMVKSHNNRIDHVIFIGQSNTIPKGVRGVSPPTAATPGEILPGACIQFNGSAVYRHPWPNYNPGENAALPGYPGAWGPDDHDAEITDDQITHFVDLEGEYSESHAFGFGELINDDNRVLLFSGHGRGSGGYSILKKGLTDDTNYAYRNSIKCIQRAKALADSLGMEYRVIAMICEHGEGDSRNANYLADLNEWIADYNADIKEISGQAQDVPMYLSQQHSWSLSGNWTTSLSVIAQLEVHEQNALAYLVAPKYFLPHDNMANGDDDGVHLSAFGIRTLSEYYGKAFKAGAGWSPLRPSAVEFDGVDTVTVSFAGRVGDLRFSVYDETTNPLGVSDPGNFGFELYDTGGAVITGVAISAAKDQVLVTVNQPLAAGAELRYAYTNQGPSNAGPLTGPRGCLCDSDPTPPSAVLQDHRSTYRGLTGAAITDPLKNWCVTFKKSIAEV